MTTYGIFTDFSFSVSIKMFEIRLGRHAYLLSNEEHKERRQL